MDVTKYHHWMVRRGSIGLVLIPDDGEVELKIDPEASNFCVLEPQDAIDVASIIGGLARPIWERFRNDEQMMGVSGGYAVDHSNSSITWPTSAGPLLIAPGAVGGLIRIGDANVMTFRMRVNPLIEIVQFLERLTEREVEDPSA